MRLCALVQLSERVTINVSMKVIITWWWNGVRSCIWLVIFIAWKIVGSITHIYLVDCCLFKYATLNRCAQRYDSVLRHFTAPTSFKTMFQWNFFLCFTKKKRINFLKKHPQIDGVFCAWFHKLCWCCQMCGLTVAWAHKIDMLSRILPVIKLLL